MMVKGSTREETDRYVSGGKSVQKDTIYSMMKLMKRYCDLTVPANGFGVIAVGWLEVTPYEGDGVYGGERR
jgi:hypothetical protein